jgi:D-glycero-beta-D-manno-heptose-7-phosphate kinase
VEQHQLLKKRLETFKDLNILVIGDLMIDRYLIGSVTRISPEAPVPIVNLEKTEEKLGGAANVALNIAGLGSNAILCSIIGHDENGILVKDLLKKEGLCADLIITSEKRPTTVKSRILAGIHQLLRLDHETTEDVSIEEERVVLDKLNQYLAANKVDAIVFQDYNKGVLTRQIIKTLIQKAQEMGIPSLVDPKKKHFWEYKGATLFKPNLREINDQLESKVLPNVDYLQSASYEIHKRLQNKYTVITLSEYGIYGTSSNENFLIPSKKRKIADVCGAGDSVISILAVSIAAGLNFEDSLKLANIGGGQVCESPGVVPVDFNKMMNEYFNS